MTANLRLVMDAAQRDPRQLPVQTPGNAHGNGSLANARRAYQTQDLSLHVGRQLPHGKHFQNTLLDLFQSEMILVQNLSCCRQINAFFGSGIPRQLQHRVQIGADHRRLGGAKGLLTQALQFLEELAFGLLWQFERLDTALIGVEFFLVVVPQFTVDHLELLTQIILPLSLVDAVLHLFLQFRLHAQHFQLLMEQDVAQMQAPVGVKLAQHLGLFPVVKGGVLSHDVGNDAGIMGGQELEHIVPKHFLAQLHKGLKLLVGHTDLRLRAGGNGAVRLLRNMLDAGAQIGVELNHRVHSAPCFALNQHTDGLPGQAQHLLDLGHRAHGTQRVKVGVVRGNVVLRHKEHPLIGVHGAIQRADRFLPAHVKMEHRPRKYRQSAQSDDRQPFEDDFFHSRLLSCCWF